MKLTFTLLSLLVLLASANAQEYDPDPILKYTGQVKVGTTLFTGTGYFKISILDNNSSSTFWSNDMSSTYADDEPTSAIQVTVDNGRFSIPVGDEDLGMKPLNRMIFAQNTPLRLRVWFSDGQHGFQKLVPDRRIFNTDLMIYRTGKTTVHLYVDVVNGNDANDGLTTQTAKKSITAAVQILPDRIECDTIIRVFPGTYREKVVIADKVIEFGKRLTILGDPNWKNNLSGDPNVRVTALNADGTGLRSRNGIDIRNIIGLTTVQGIYVDSAWVGFSISKSYVHLLNCLARNSYWGMGFYETGIFVDVQYCTVEQSANEGIVFRNSNGNLLSCKSRNNGANGVCFGTKSVAYVNNNCEFRNNASQGILVTDQSLVWFNGEGSNPYSCISSSNGLWGLEVRYDSTVRSASQVSLSGNVYGNTIHTIFGGTSY